MFLNENATKKEIFDFFKEAVYEESIFKLMTVYKDAVLYEKLQERKGKIADVVGRDNIKDIIIIDDTIAIVVKLEKWGDEPRKDYYYPVVNGKRMIQVAETLDYALVLALSTKYGEEQCAPKMIYNMLNMYKFDVADKLSK